MVRSGGKDLCLRIWHIPEKWLGSEVQDFEEKQVKDLTAKMVKKKIVKKYRKNENGEIDSDDDDLNGWNFNDY